MWLHLDNAKSLTYQADYFRKKHFQMIAAIFTSILKLDNWTCGCQPSLLVRLPIVMCTKKVVWLKPASWPTRQMTTVATSCASQTLAVLCMSNYILFYYPGRTYPKSTSDQPTDDYSPVYVKLYTVLLPRLHLPQILFYPHLAAASVDVSHWSVPHSFDCPLASLWMEGRHH